MRKIFPVNCFLARDTVAFSPSHRFHIAVMVFSFGHEGVVLGAEFTVNPTDKTFPAAAIIMHYALISSAP